MRFSRSRGVEERDVLPTKAKTLARRSSHHNTYPAMIGKQASGAERGVMGRGGAAIVSKATRSCSLFVVGRLYDADSALSSYVRLQQVQEEPSAFRHHLRACFTFLLPLALAATGRGVSESRFRFSASAVTAPGPPKVTGMNK